MFIPLLASMLGFAFTGLFAFAFSDLGVIAAGTQSWLVIIGSTLIVWGAEANTPFTVIEVFRKILRHEHNAWDISALVASLTGTTINVLVTFASRQTLFGDSVWRVWALSWGPLLAGIAVTLDYYGGMIELGFLFGSYEIRLTEYNQWLNETGQSVTQIDDKLTQQLDWLTQRIKAVDQELDRVADFGRQVDDRWTWLTATSDQVNRATEHLNGDRANLTRQELGVILAEHKLNLPSPATVRRGFK